MSTESTSTLRQLLRLARDRDASLSMAHYHRVAIASLVLLSVIVVTGAAVRLTDSGLGCEDWPRCNSTSFIDMSSGHMALEQGNRLFSGVVALAVAAAVLGAFRMRPRRRDHTGIALGLVAGVVGQIVLGGITVLTELHPVAVQGHFLLSMVLVALATVLVRRTSSSGGIRTEAGPFRRHRIALAWLVGVVLVVGTVVTAAGPHAGDENAERLDVSISAVARVHGITVLVTLAVGLALALRLWQVGADRRVLNLMSSWVFVGFLQGTIGYVQYLNGVPELLVGAHITGATGLWILTIALATATQPAMSRAQDPGQPDSDRPPVEPAGAPR